MKHLPPLLLVFLLILTLFLIVSPLVERQHQRELDNQRRLMEYAYFSGQREALTGDVRISFDESTKRWVWVKSPWNNGLVPLFEPRDWRDDKTDNPAQRK